MKLRLAKLAVLSCALASASAFAQYQKGPDPTTSALERAGSFATRTISVSSLAASGFGGGRIYYPTAAGSYGVAGHSMGGGGTLIAAADNPSLKAAVPMAPWNLSSLSFRNIRVPTMIFGCQSDAIAPVNTHSVPFYNAIPSSTSKGYVEMRLDDHFCVMNGGGHYETLGKLGISWFKRFIDQDTRYSKFLCGTEYNSTVRSTEVSDSKNNCPY